MSHVTTYGGVGQEANGGAGSIYIKDMVSNAEQIVGDNSDRGGIPTELVSEDGAGFEFGNLTIAGKSISIDKISVSNDLVIDGVELFVGDMVVANDVMIKNGGILSHKGATTTKDYSTTVDVNGKLIVDASSRIDVSERGYLGGYMGGNNSQYGRTLGNTITGGSFAHSGGSYGGIGGRYSNQQVNSIYGSFYDPNELGSGGGGNTATQPGGNGGGLVRITATEIALEGSIMSNGGDGGDTTYNGGGSGGGIYIEVGKLSGAGMIKAHGGKDSTDHGATTGGGGGRIAIYYNDISKFDMSNVTAYGGVGQNANGGAGTKFLKSSLQVNGDLIVDNNNLATSGFSTPLVSIGTGVSTALTVDKLTDNTRGWRSNELTGIFLNPNTSQGTTPATVFKILSNDATSITVDNTFNNLTDVAISGNSYIGEHYFDNLSVINGARVETLDRINFSSILVTSGGEIQAENYYQIGKAETSPIEKLANHYKDEMRRAEDEGRLTSEDGRGTNSDGREKSEDGRKKRGKGRLTKEGIQIISEEFNAHKVKFSIPDKQHDEAAKTIDVIKEKTHDNYKETAKVDVGLGKISG
jgi:hypothetical protein